LKITENFSLKNYNTFKLDCTVKEFIEVSGREEFENAVLSQDKKFFNFFILGNGSNILLPEYFDGTIVKFTGGGVREVDDKANNLNKKIINADCDVLLSTLCKYCLENSLTGMEWAYGIPGTVGGAVYMNAGAYGGDMSQVVESVGVISNDWYYGHIDNNICEFSYRHSIFMQKAGTILDVDFCFEKGEKSEIKAKMDENLAKRKDKQPLTLPSAGSFFKRPTVKEGELPVYAAKLIEDCGLKGFSVGGAAVSEKHAGFVVNLGNATFKDIMTLAEKVREKVFKETGFFLEIEPKVAPSAFRES
jgi:UDP-N-acetylmuramate dehydrogenase